MVETQAASGQVAKKESDTVVVPLSFFSFPGEVRNKIYRLLFFSTGEIDIWSTRPKHLSGQALHVSRKFHEEAGSMLYGDNTFNASESWLGKLYSVFHGGNADKIRHVHMRYNCDRHIRDSVVHLYSQPEEDPKRQAFEKAVLRNLHSLTIDLTCHFNWYSGAQIEWYRQGVLSCLREDMVNQAGLPSERIITTTGPMLICHTLCREIFRIQVAQMSLSDGAILIPLGAPVPALTTIDKRKDEKKWKLCNKCKDDVRLASDVPEENDA